MPTCPTEPTAGRLADTPHPEWGWWLPCCTEYVRTYIPSPPPVTCQPRPSAVQQSACMQLCQHQRRLTIHHDYVSSPSFSAVVLVSPPWPKTHLINVHYPGKHSHSIITYILQVAPVAKRQQMLCHPGSGLCTQGARRGPNPTSFEPRSDPIRSETGFLGLTSSVYRVSLVVLLLIKNC